MQSSSIFLGVTTAPARDIIADLFVASKSGKFFLPCVGRFTIPLALLGRGVKPEQIYSSDIGIFSSIIGYLADESKSLSDLAIKLPEKFPKEKALFDATDDYDFAAAVMLWFKYSQFPTTHAFGLAHRKEILGKWSDYHADVRRKLVNVVERLRGINYEMRDVWEVVGAEKEDDKIALYVNVPTYKGGYVKMFKAANVEWNEPNVEQFDYDLFPKLIEESRTRAGITLCYAQKNLEKIGDGWQVVFGQFFNVDRTDYLVSNKNVDKIFSKQKLPEKVTKPFPIYADEEITIDSKVSFVKVTRDVCMYYRDLFVHKLGVTNAETYLLMLIDGRVVTALGLNTQFLRQMKSNFIYEVFGISVTSVRYFRLGKFFMFALTSGDMRQWLIRNYNFGIKEPAGIQTTSITTHEEGKTDRSVLKLTHREKRPDGRFRVIYRGEFRDDTWADCLAVWIKRWGKKSRPAEKPKTEEI